MIVNMKCTSRLMKIYKVLISELFIGMRIEGFINHCYIFTIKKKALEFAYQKACEYSNKFCQLIVIDASGDVNSVFYAVTCFDGPKHNYCRTNQQSCH